MISVIVPAYNEQQFIERNLKALLSQDFPRNGFEIIVSDSSSTDKTVQIAKKYADAIVSCKKVSAGFGRNNGAKHAKGKILAFIDADTIAGPNWLRGIEAALGNADSIAATGPFKTLERTSLSEKVFFGIWRAEIKASTLLGRPMFAGFNFAVKKAAFDAVGGFREDDMVCEDIDLSLKLRKLGKVKFNKDMEVRTSARRLKEVGVLEYARHGLMYTFFKKKYSWSDHRGDW